MNKKVFIRQDGTIPGRRIIEELERRGGIHANSYLGGGNCIFAYYYIAIDFVIDTLNEPPQGYTELLYNKETDTFYEKSQRIISAEAKEALLSDGYYKTDIQNDIKTFTIMTEGEYNIPEGYEAEIEDGKVIVRKKKWEPKEGDLIWYVRLDDKTLIFSTEHYTFYNGYTLDLGDFQTEEEAQTFCDKLNDAAFPILEERRKEVEL